jgi:hypothetical protein
MSHKQKEITLYTVVQRRLGFLTHWMLNVLFSSLRLWWPEGQAMVLTCHAAPARPNASITIS